MKYHVEVNTTGDRPDTWTGNRVDHKTAEIAEAAARDLFMRWTAVKYWRVTDDDGLVTASNR
jgi:hypothetical protein